MTPPRSVFDLSAFETRWVRARRNQILVDAYGAMLTASVALYLLVQYRGRITSGAVTSVSLLGILLGVVTLWVMFSWIILDIPGQLRGAIEIVVDRFGFRTTYPNGASHTWLWAARRVHVRIAHFLNRKMTSTNGGRYVLVIGNRLPLFTPSYRDSVLSPEAAAAILDSARSAGLKVTVRSLGRMWAEPGSVRYTITR